MNFHTWTDEGKQHFVLSWDEDEFELATIQFTDTCRHWWPYYDEVTEDETSTSDGANITSALVNED